MKTDADFSGGGNLIVDAAVIRKNVRVIEDRRAAGRRQLGEPDERRPPCRLGGAARPQPVMNAQPRKEVVVLRAGKFRVSVWSRWWWAFTKPGKTIWPERSSTWSALGGSRSVGPTCSMIPSLANRPAFFNSRRSASIVTNTSAFLARSVGIGVWLRQKKTISPSVCASAFGSWTLIPGVGISVSAVCKNQRFTIFIWSDHRSMSWLDRNGWLPGGQVQEESVSSHVARLEGGPG